MLLQPGQEIELQIDSLSNQGAGVGRWQGLAVFVPGALPQETARVRVRRCKKSYAEADLLSLQKAAPQRCQPPCPVFAACGGCLLQHLAPQAQLSWKRLWLQDALRRIGGLELDVPAIPPAAPFAYRNRVQLHVAWQGERLQLGFYARDSKDLVPVTHCLLMRPLLHDLACLLPQYLPAYQHQLQDLKHVVLRCNSEGSQALISFVGLPASPALTALAKDLQAAEPRLVSVWANGGPPVYGIYGGSWHKLLGAEHLQEQLGPLRLSLSAAAFVQVNPEQTLLLYEQARNFAALTGAETVLDLYSGIGSVALYLARQARQVIGVEEYAPAVRDAERNAALNGSENCRFIAARAEQALPQLVAEGQQAQVAILDPPRAGCAAAVLQAVAALGVQRIIYISCDAATLARDLRLLGGWGYQAQEIRAFDLFPQTGSLESVTLLLREG